eukprot:scaffold80671_cov33-Tisochrysis_lutea.AAC.2
MLRYASAALQNCQQVVLETVRQDGMIPCSAREVLKNDSKRRCAAGELLLNSPPIALEGGAGRARSSGCSGIPTSGAPRQPIFLEALALRGKMFHYSGGGGTLPNEGQVVYFGTLRRLCSRQKEE